MKEEIVKRALNDFMQYGFKTFTMDDLANKMGIIHCFLIKTETEGKTIQNYELSVMN